MQHAAPLQPSPAGSFKATGEEAPARASDFLEPFPWSVNHVHDVLAKGGVDSCNIKFLTRKYSNDRLTGLFVPLMLRCTRRVLCAQFNAFRLNSMHWLVDLVAQRRPACCNSSGCTPMN
eukprot:1278740-Amphidinium_carterae.1